MRRHGLLYALGVLVSFLAFAALLVVLQSLGHAIGWGFQLQSPVFVALLLALFLALALNLSGVFEFSFVLSAGIKPKGKNADAFLTGVLAVAVASPCTAPFMGAALGYALAGGPADALAVFTALGAGMALPYVALAWNPQWLGWLPRPGAWMVRFKQLLAIPLYATVLWLGWVLALQSGLLAGRLRLGKVFAGESPEVRKARQIGVCRLHGRLVRDLPGEQAAGAVAARRGTGPAA